MATQRVYALCPAVPGVWALTIETTPLARAPGATAAVRQRGQAPAPARGTAARGRAITAAGRTEQAIDGRRSEQPSKRDQCPPRAFRGRPLDRGAAVQRGEQPRG